MTMRGLFDLQTPEHLLHKLEWEYAQWRDDPLNTYRAWNFFVTAEHLPDWLGRTNSQALGGSASKILSKRSRLPASVLISPMAGNISGPIPDGIPR